MSAEATIKATDETIHDIVRSEIERLGDEADLNHIDTSQVTNMAELFVRSEGFHGDVSQWDTSKVVTMELLFTETKFNGDVSRWDVSSVTNMYGLFAEGPFNGDISRWDVSNVLRMESLFADSAFNGDISSWVVRDDCKTNSALDNCPVLTSPRFSKLHFMYKWVEGEVYNISPELFRFIMGPDEPIRPPDSIRTLHPDAEVAYATHMAAARALFPDKPVAVLACRAWESYVASRYADSLDLPDNFDAA